MHANLSGMARPILIAGLLGGVLGGVVSFAAGRLIKPPEPVKSDPIPNEARERARSFIAKLRAGKFEEFAQDARAGTTIRTEAAFTEFQSKLLESRVAFTNGMGPTTGEFELLQETIAGTSLVRFVYLEKFERGGVVWILVLYRDRDSAWRLTYLDYGWNVAGVFAGLS